MPTEHPLEIELKFALPTFSRAELEERLQRVPLMSRHKPRRTRLISVYYDTPQYLLRSKKMALRVRQMGSAAKPCWVQTFKTSPATESALSQRGEWEFALQRNQLDFDVLCQSTPWREFDPDGQIFRSLRPCFVTDFERTSWKLRGPDGSAMEVALDTGCVRTDGQVSPLCELELELLDGSAESLYAVAQRMALDLPLLPLNVSKAERGYRLIQGTVHAPVTAKPLALSSSTSVLGVAKPVLHEMFWQFCGNLNLIRSSDAPEILHQARVGWRRFRSALKFFGQQLVVMGVPSLMPLRNMLDAMAQLRDLDVAANETLPMLSRPYTMGDPQRQKQWAELEQVLALNLHQQRQRLLDALQDPQVGSCLLEVARWLEAPWLTNAHGLRATDSAMPVADWARRRVVKLVHRLSADQNNVSDPMAQHRRRIIAKRLRYCIEAVRPLLPRRRFKHWYQLAIEQQARLGRDRDLLLAVTMVGTLPVSDGIKEFLRGVWHGRQRDAEGCLK